MTFSCRFCSSQVDITVADLGLSPLANSYVPVANATDKESFYPLHAYVCSECFLVQLDEFESPEHIFGDYLYFSSFSQSWLDHSARYVDAMTARFSLDGQSKVVEIASNDGYLLQYFVRNGVPVLGVEPAANVAATAVAAGVPTEVAFFGRDTATRLRQDGHGADLMAANNVLAHVPNINDFVGGFAVLLNPEGVVTFEFPHLLNLIEQRQFDTIYHEHFSYLSASTVNKVLEKHGLRLFDVEELPTHGGSLRVFGCHSGASHATSPRVAAMLDKERAKGLLDLDTYRRFSEAVIETKCDVLSFFIEAKKAGKSVVGYGAPAKGNTLLNYCGVKTDFLQYTVDRNHHKQNHLLPGTRIPILSPDEILKTKPDYIFILPWNLKDEISEQMKEIREWGGKFVTPIPRVTVF